MAHSNGTTNGTTPKKLSIAIAGGGIGGLCLAIGLQQHAHLDVRIYEGVASYKDVGAGLALHLNAIRAMDLIAPSIKKTYFARALNLASDAETEMSTQVLLGEGASAGVQVAELGRAKGRKTVARSDLLAGLVELIPSDRIEFGKRVASIEEGEAGRVTVAFKDGTSVTADALIGADGVHSATRSFLLGADHPATPPQNHDGWQIYRTLVPVEEALKYVDEKWTKTVPIICGPRGHINCMPLHMGKDISAGVAVRGARKGIAEGVTPELRTEDFSGYSADARAFVELVAKDTSASWAVQDHDHAPYYYRRNVAMMGDAAHCAMPFAGQGAAQAIEDCAVLTALFGRVTDAGQVEKAFAAYDKVRRPRSQRVVEISRDFGTLYAYAMPGYGDDPVKMKSFFGKSAMFTNNANLDEQNENALKAFEESL